MLGDYGILLLIKFIRSYNNVVFLVKIEKFENIKFFIEEAKELE